MRVCCLPGTEHRFQQMLFALPGWFLLFLIGAAALAEGMNRRRNLKIGFWLFTIAFATSVRCSPLTTVALPDFLIGRTVLSASPQESASDFAAMDDLVYDRRIRPRSSAWPTGSMPPMRRWRVRLHDPPICCTARTLIQYAALPDIHQQQAGFASRVPGTHFPHAVL